MMPTCEIFIFVCLLTYITVYIKICESFDSEKKLTFLTIVPPSLKHMQIKAKLESKFRYRRLFIEDYRLYFKTYAMQSQSPDEVLTLFCDIVMKDNVNTIFLVRNTDAKSETAMSDYISKLTETLGIPLISWDPSYIGSLQRREMSRMLHVAPTVYHQCQAMLDILRRYNWTDFSVISDSSVHDSEFFNSIRELVKMNNEAKGHVIKRKFKILSEAVIDTQQSESGEGVIDKMLTEEIAKETRIFLIHTKSLNFKNIMDRAQVLNMTGSAYMWILSSESFKRSMASCASRHSEPIGLFGIEPNASNTVLFDTIEQSFELWISSLRTYSSISKALPGINVSYIMQNDSMFWEGGDILFRKMRNASPDRGVQLDFDESGVVRSAGMNVWNVQSDSRRVRGRLQCYSHKMWKQIGRWTPKTVYGRTEMVIEMEGIKWMGNGNSPPKGRPDKIVLKIATLEEKPYVIYREPDETTGICQRPSVPCRTSIGSVSSEEGPSNETVPRCCAGLCIDLLQILSERIGFEYDLFEVPDKTWGKYDNSSGKWTGLIGILHEQEVDMAMTSLKVTQERNEQIEFSVPFLETGITILVSIRKGAISPTAFLEPYDYPSWCLILVLSVHATGASTFIFEWLSPSGLHQGKTLMKEHKFSLFRSFWLIWAMLFGASVSVDNPRGVSSRFLANVWALFALVFLASYTANLAAFMITKEEYYDLSGIEDWRLKNPYAMKPPFRFATVPNGSEEENLKRNYPDIYRYMRQFNQLSVKAGVESLKKHKIHAFIYDATVLEWWAGMDQDCDLTTVGNWYAVTGYGVGLPRGSKWLGQVNQVILQLQEDGEMERLQKFWLAGACHAKEKTGQTSQRIGILNFTSAFILLAVGVVVGGLLLVFEHLYFKFGRKCLRKYDKNGCCAMISLSMGKSLTFEQSVMEAIDYHKRHRCKDPICETQMWKVKHQLDIALLKLEQYKHTDTIISSKNDISDTELNNIEILKADDTKSNHTVCGESPKIVRDTTTELLLSPDDSDDSCTEMLGEDDKQDNNFEYRRSMSYTEAVSVHDDKEHSAEAALLPIEI